MKTFTAAEICTAYGVHPSGGWCELIDTGEVRPIDGVAVLAYDLETACWTVADVQRRDVLVSVMNRGGFACEIAASRPIWSRVSEIAAGGGLPPVAIEAIHRALRLASGEPVWGENVPDFAC